ncbi:PstS family phosphate ABC transporter substrate-binding protein [Desulfobacter vibrioformis]|uniref:PstS family phosphate ABC transporter substrate-binding protein n=1 Tax=Desulfobacter vibrioformis TaxID=34031 RepID=UPI0005583C0A|nr:substrate-binding domain-containing protein [Desulfobacter vibrioformis]
MKYYSLILFVCFMGWTALAQPGVAAKEELIIVGTGAGMPVIQAVGKAFTRKNPGIRVRVPPSIGSGGAIKAVGKGEYLLGRVARDIADKEIKYGLTQTPLAKLPIIFYTNASVVLDSITPEQACAIYSGTMRTWEVLNAGTGPIRVIRREEGDSSLNVLIDRLPGFATMTPTQVAKITYTDQETVDTCAHVKNSIAYGALADVINLLSIHVVRISGIAPSDPAYPYFAPLDLVYKPENYQGSLKRFVEFLSSAGARKAIRDTGGLPVN